LRALVALALTASVGPKTGRYGDERA
jgi:hypothetical protein